MITAIIVDDEKNSQDLLRKMVSRHCTDVSIVGTAENVEKAVGLIYLLNPDLVFLDVEMPNGNGFTLFDKMKNTKFDVIFTTAYEEYSIKAFRVSAIDYLLKPIDYRQLQEAIIKIKNKQSISLKEQRLSLLLENISNKSDTFRKFALPVKDGYVLINLEDIIYIEADINYSTVFLVNGARIVTTKNIKYYEDLLPITTFFRCHKSHIINLNLVKRYNKINCSSVTMADGKDIDISDRKQKAFLDLITKL